MWTMSGGAFGARLAARCVVLALAAGTALVSCTTEGRRPCRETCHGCCAQEECVAPFRQSFGQCGDNGAQCRACLPGDVCSAVGTCMPDPGTLVIPTTDAGRDCGGRGEPCCPTGAGCFSTLSCVGGTCEVIAPTEPDAGRPDASGPGAGIGSPCTQNAECQFNHCAKGRFPGGYCSKTCATNADCPAGATCSLDPADATGLSRICLVACAAPGAVPGGCRAGYVCEKKNTSLDGTPVCTPACAGPADCRSPSTCDGRGLCCGVDGYACCDGTTCASGSSCVAGYCKQDPPQPPMDGGTLQPSGAACTAGTQCQGGLCSKESAAGSSACPATACWPGGYCTQGCGSGAACAPGSSCSPFFPPTALVTLCLKNCTYDGGQGDCRQGYVCDRYWIPNASQATCVYACKTDDDCPAVNTKCNSRRFCCGKTSFSCCDGNTCPFGGTCGASGFCE